MKLTNYQESQKMMRAGYTIWSASFIGIRDIRTYDLSYDMITDNRERYSDIVKLCSETVMPVWCLEDLMAIAVKNGEYTFNMEDTNKSTNMLFHYLFNKCINDWHETK